MGLGPFLHVVEHQDDHVHLPGGGIMYVDRSAPVAPRPSEPESPAPVAPEHGQGGLAHFGAASLTSPKAPSGPDAPTWAVLEPCLLELRAAPRPRWAAPRPARDPPGRV